MRRWAARLLVAVVVVVGGAGWSAGAASAHALRQSSQPDAGAEVAQPPRAVSITFGETPDPKVSSIRVLDTAGHGHTTSHATAAAGDPRTLVVPVDRLGDGVYTVTWRTLSLVDGHSATGTFAFGVGTAPTAAAGGTATSTAGSSTGLTPTAVAARWLLYSGLIVLAGGALLGGITPVRDTPRLFRLLCIAWAAASVGTLAVAVLAQRAAGLPLTSLLRTSLTRQLGDRGVPLVVVGAVLGRTQLLAERRLSRVPLAVVSIGAMTSMAGDVAASHAAAAASLRWFHMAAQLAHFIAAGVWIGGLVTVALTLGCLDDHDRLHTARRFSTLALLSVVVVAATGTQRAIAEVATLHALTSTTFGQAVLIKIGLLVVLIAFGAFNRFRTIGRADTAPQLLRRAVRAELIVAAIVLVATGILQTSAPPASARPAATPKPIVARGHDFATTANVTLSVGPGTAGFNTYTVRATDYDTGAAITDASVQLRFALPSRPDIGEATTALTRRDSIYVGRGAELSLNGAWRVTVVIQRASGAIEVPLTVTTRLPHYNVTVTYSSGLPDVYTIHVAAGLDVQTYVDPAKGGLAEVHVTFLSGDQEVTASGLIVTARAAGTTEQPLVVRNLDGVGHYVADLPNPTTGKYTFTVSATTDQQPVVAAITMPVTTG